MSARSARRKTGIGGRATTSVAASAVALILVAAVLGPWIAPFDPVEANVLLASQGPNAVHWLGTDSLGRDILSRALAGARLSISAPAMIVLLSGVIGTGLAMFSAWHGGALDQVLVRLLNVMFSIPGILVAIIAAATFGTGFWAPVIALSLVYIPYVARVVRSVAIVERRRGYVEGLQLAGASVLRINIRHILPNLFPIILAQITFGFGAALADFAAISFIGVGVQPPRAEWGVMLADGRSELLNGAMMQSLVAGTLVVASVVGFNFLGTRVAGGVKS
ncbi:ABC transporter permease [Leucobacter sp. G161]|uniref:ABC transporter permease n=1 Tax=Leucobacter sp. G161 TaxID=663704 RepID=UPI00191013AD|nr:ABC transporter permease [Leucobacter sp. G161]